MNADAKRTANKFSSNNNNDAQSFVIELKHTSPSHWLEGFINLSMEQTRPMKND